MIRFANQHYSILLIGVPAIILLYIFADTFRKRSLNKIGEREFIKNMLLFFNPAARVWRRILFVIGYIFLVFAIMRPQIGTKLEKVKRQGIDIVFALDVSKSMLAEDLKPNRLSNAKNEIREFIRRRSDDRFALVPFAGDAFVMCPLTMDFDAYLMFLNAVDENTIEEPGTDLGKALQISIKAFVDDKPRYKAIVLITDGEQTASGDPVSVAREIAKTGVKIFTIGVGTPTGDPIPIKDERSNIIGYKKDPETGAIVTSKLDEETLAKISELTAADYFSTSSGRSELKEIFANIDKMGKKELETFSFSNYEEIFYYPLSVAIVLFWLFWCIPERSKKLKSL